MKMKKIVSIILLISIIISPGSILAVDTSSLDYEKGYDAGLEMGMENFGTNTSISRAFSQFKRDNDIARWDEEIFYEGFRDGYEVGMTGKTITVDYADILGTTLGSIYGARDFQSAKDSNWQKALPSNKEIISMFNLDRETREYREKFIPIFKDSFQEGYSTNYERVLLEPARITLQQGIKDGEDLGGLLGTTYGLRDYFNKRNKDFERDLPSKRNIVSYYSLNRDNDEYEEGFLSGFLKAYEEKYNEAFRKANYDNFMRDEADAQDNGREVGVIKGEIQAIEDYMLDRSSDWKRSLSPERSIIMEYELLFHSPNYRAGFVAGFFDGYSEGYQSKYKELSQSAAVEKSTSQLIPIKGGSLTSSDGTFSLNIEAGTYYHQVNLVIDTNYNVDKYQSSQNIKASNDYRIRIVNTSGNLDNSKKIELSFEYYGDRQRGGIYKLINGKWNYISSFVEGNNIKALISPSSIESQSNTYSVFIENLPLVLRDSRSHWAKEEINTYVKRGILSGYPDGTFKPEQGITRAEFLTILSRIYNWNLAYYYDDTHNFLDRHSFGMYNNVINYSASYGYINGYHDGTFKPNNPITYKEVELIMSRVLNDTSFRWSNIANKMLYERKVRSESLSNYNNRINRAEVVYMLYEITE